MTNIQFISALKLRLQEPLPGWSAQSKYIPQKGLPDVQFNTNKELRKGAVLICLYEDEGNLTTVLIERTQDSSPHSGQIAFPGGKYEERDKNQTTTAFREAWEEVGLATNELELIGALSPVEIPVSGFTVLPIIAWHKAIPNLTPNPVEVESIIKTPVADMLNSLEVLEIKARGHQVTTPCFKANQHIVWGATAMVLGELQSIISEINPRFLKEQTLMKSN